MSRRSSSSSSASSSAPSRARPRSLPWWLLPGGAVLLLVGTLIGYLLRSAAEPPATPTVVPATPSAATGTGSQADASCSPGEPGPLRQNLSFTAADDPDVTVNYSVSLPEGYYDGCDTYPVVYALHGKGEDNASFMPQAESLRAAMAAGVLDQAIIITPDSFRTGRWEDRDTGPAETNFIERLIPHVDATYRVRPGASQRLLVGFSMGGHGAMRFGLKYPEEFAAVWSVDGAMADPASYTDLVGDRTSADFHIVAVGGQLNGSRVQTTIDALKQRGIDIPSTYQDREHEFSAFVEEDEKVGGWFAMKFLQQNLGRPM